jgi:transcription elongation GreA/GreB family factor
VARALMGHQPGDTVEVHLPRGTRRLLITQVEA